MTAPHPPAVGPDQERYASVLAWCTRVGFAALVVFFVAYASGLFPSEIARAHLPEIWTLPAAEMLRVTGQHGGWAWLRLLDRIDMAALASIAVLALSPLPPLLAIMPIYWRTGRRALFAICALEIGVILFAASGLVGSAR